MKKLCIFLILLISVFCRHPVVYEISTRPWLYELSKLYGKNITKLRQIPLEEFDELANNGVDIVWMMGVWSLGAVGHFQPMVRLFPCAETDEIVPLGDQVIQRTPRHHPADRQACLTERNAAVHTTLALTLAIRFTDRGVELVIMFDTFFHSRRGIILSCIFHKSVGISHTALLLILSGSADRRLRS